MMIGLIPNHPTLKEAAFNNYQDVSGNLGEMPKGKDLKR
jgi:hypothetical protein